MSYAFPSDRSPRALVNELYAHGFAVVAALSSVYTRLRVSEESLRGLISSYLSVTKTQISRIEQFASDHAIALDPAGEEQMRGELRLFARELARGLLSRQLEISAVNAMLRLAFSRLDLYRAGGEALPAALAPVFAAGEAEEVAVIDGLAFHREALIDDYACHRRAE
ncbi:MAG: hypothetical protein JWM57_1038 [Phycisphaerales bacterium]|nr:hypothetical protein [Phycisphaerales bacterium]